MATYRSTSCRVGAVTQTEARITFVSKSTATPTVTCSGGSVAQTAMDDRYDNGGVSIAVSTITITGLSGSTKYTYTITQGSDVINGSFKTMPNNGDNFSFIVSSCDSRIREVQRPFTIIRGLMNDTDYPLVAQFHIDDVSYVDSMRINDGVYTSSGQPQDTGLGRDYAVAWGNYYGLMGGGGVGQFSGAKFTLDDRHYVYQNLPSFVSGGDHAVEDNHCRGRIGASDYHGCDRTPGGIEEVAKAEWDAFLGNANVDPLTTDKWHWGVQIGSVKFALFDYSLYSEPYDSSAPDADLVGYGSEQITAITNYMDDSTVQWKCFLMESPPTVFGQPWLDWHPNEAGAWKTAFDANDNLNGVDGNAFTACGDNHALFAIKYDTFWNFCGGTFNSGAVDNNMGNAGTIANLAATWSGQTMFHEHAIAETGDRLLGGFWHFKVTGTSKIEATCYSSTGSKFVKDITLTANATDNQWVMPRAKLA